MPSHCIFHAIMRGTMSCSVRFSGSMFDLHIFADADWAGNRLTNRSTTVYVIFAAGGHLV